MRYELNYDMTCYVTCPFDLSDKNQVVDWWCKWGILYVQQKEGGEVLQYHEGGDVAEHKRPYSIFKCNKDICEEQIL